ncbi:unnamed protein product [Rotaria socialis]|uniref:Uncharacterized protein n=1 Tax=Rotaria socialis TaxID=392032 RepID=A0A821SYJ2_9BILA|nr:unnamed protein product [Rotaria socialis]
MITLEKIIFTGSEYISPPFMRRYNDYRIAVNVTDTDTNSETSLVAIVLALIKTCSNFPMRELTLSGKLSIQIIEALLENSPNLEVLSIPNLENLRYSLLQFFFKCRNLRELYLPIREEDIFCCDENFEFEDKDAFYVFFAVMFRNCYKQFFERNDTYRQLFPNLRLVDFGTKARSGYLGCRIVLHQLDNNIYRWMLHGNRRYKPSLEMDYFETMLNEENENSQIQYFNMVFPMCKDIAITSWNQHDLLFPEIAKGEIKSNALELLLRSTLSFIGVNITTINICTHPIFNDGFTVGFLQDILINCPSLVILKLVVRSTHNFNFTALVDAGDQFAFHANKLREIWLRESVPDFCTPCLVFNECDKEYIGIQWVKLMNLLQLSSVDLKVFCTNVSDDESMAIVIDNLCCNAQTFSLEYFKFCNIDITFEQLRNIIQRSPNLRNLYLKGIDGDVFWKLKRHFDSTAIKIFWGALNGVYTTYNHE